MSILIPCSLLMLLAMASDSSRLEVRKEMRLQNIP